MNSMGQEDRHYPWPSNVVLQWNMH